MGAVIAALGVAEAGSHVRAKLGPEEATVVVSCQTVLLEEKLQDSR